MEMMSRRTARHPLTPVAPRVLRTSVAAAVMALVAGVATPLVHADDASDIAALQQQLQSLQKQIDALKAQRAVSQPASGQATAGQGTAAPAGVASAQTAPAETNTAGATPGGGISVGANTTVGGQAFFDFSRIVEKSNNVDVAPSGTGFDVKRAYIIVNHTFNNVYSANITTDAQYSSSTTAGSGGVTEFFVKKLYLQAKYADAFVLHVGAFDSPWISVVEPLYGYRWIDKTTLDRLGFANTVDWGLNAAGKFAGGYVFYTASVVDGGGYKNPTRTRDVDVEAAAGVNPFSWLTLAAGVYDGHLGQITETVANYPQNTAHRWDLTAAVNVAGIHVGAEYFDAKNYKAATASTGVFAGPGGVVVAGTATGVPLSDEATGVSAWASYDFNDHYSIFSRFDHTQPSKDIDTLLRQQYYNFGFDYKPIKQLDVALVYKREQVTHGVLTVSGADANGSYTIGGTGVATTGPKTDGTFEEFGLYSQFKF